MKNEIGDNYIRAKTYSEREIKAHITKLDGTFFNGVITEVKPDFFFIIDEKNGRELVFFAELKGKIEEYRELKK